MNLARHETTGKALGAVLDRLPGAKRSGHNWQARCPAHDDGTASLSVSEGRDGRALLKCHAGCETPAIVEALGLGMTDLFPPGERRTVPDARDPDPKRRPAMVKSYDYRDESGTLLYQSLRYVPKKFTQRQVDGHGGFLPTMDGARLVPYRLPELIEAVALERMIYVVEGEKDADALAALGLAATTNIAGAGKWRDDYSAHLEGAAVTILPDNDAPGRKHAEQVARSLTAHGATVRVVELPGIPPKGDVSDWLAAGGTVRALEDLVAAAPVWSPDDVLPPDEAPADDEGDADDEDAPRFAPAVCALHAPPPEPIRWSVRGLLTAGDLALFAGDGGSFKTTSMLHVAGAIAGGYAAFDAYATTQGPALVWSAEDPAGVLLNRLEAIAAGHGWDRERVLGNVHFITGAESNLGDPAWRAHLLAEVARIRPAFVGIDPLAEVLDGDENDNTAMRAVVKFARRLGAVSGATVTIVHHTGKAGADKRIQDRIRGASALSHGSRCTYVFEGRDDGLAVECLKLSRSVLPSPFMLVRKIEAAPGNAAEWRSARLTVESPDAARETRAEQFIVTQLMTSVRPLTTTDLRTLAHRTGHSGQDIAKGLTLLQARGRIEYDTGPKNAKLWRLACLPERFGNQPSDVVACLPDGCPAITEAAPSGCQPPIGGQPRRVGEIASGKQEAA